MLWCFHAIARKPLLDERTVKLNAPVAKGGGYNKNKKYVEVQLIFNDSVEALSIYSR